MKELKACSNSTAKFVEDAQQKAELERQMRERKLEIERQRREAEATERAREEGVRRRAKVEKDKRLSPATQGANSFSWSPPVSSPLCTQGTALIPPRSRHSSCSSGQTSQFKMILRRRGVGNCLSRHFLTVGFTTLWVGWRLQYRL